MMAPNATTDTSGAEGEGEFEITYSVFLEVLGDVAAAAQITAEIECALIDQILSRKNIPVPNLKVPDCDHEAEEALSFSRWWLMLETRPFTPNEPSRWLTGLTLAVAFMREKSRLNQSISGKSLANVWNLIFNASSYRIGAFSLSSHRSSVGSFSIFPLYSLITNPRDVKLFGLHIQVPGRPVAGTKFAIHPLQTFAQSRVLDGEGKEKSCDKKAVEDPKVATLAEYSVTWRVGKVVDEKIAAVVNSGHSVRATQMVPVIRSRDTTYFIPAAAFDMSEVPSNILHATLVFLDSRHKLVTYRHETQFIRNHVARRSLQELVSKMDRAYQWERLMEQGRQYSFLMDFEQALRAFNRASNLCRSIGFMHNATYYEHSALVESLHINRKIGRYEQGRNILEAILQDMGPSVQRIRLSGELGIIYRHTNRFLDAKRVFEIQYDTAKELRIEGELFRAHANIGMINYQLFLQNPDDVCPLERGIEQLSQLVKIVRRLKEAAVAQAPNKQAEPNLLVGYAVRECIGLQRLSLCYTAYGNGEKAINMALEAVDASRITKVMSVVAMSQFHYGHALKMNGRLDEAGRVFRSTSCLAAVTFLCREPSEEHHAYLRELVEAGIEVDFIDENGYTALDYTVLNGDSVSEKLVRQGLTQGTNQEEDQKLDQRLMDAKRKKGYREFFQEKLRPVLFSRKANLVDLRQAYADALAEDEWKGEVFDGFKCVPYVDFVRFGKLPRSTDGLTRSLSGNAPHYVVFISYRWINNSRGSSPDDDQNTQYRRMLLALEKFMSVQTCIRPESLFIWLDYACINQHNPDSGIWALPLNLAQCDAMISLVDDKYHSRAWCSVETLIMQTLIKSYQSHAWYQQVFVPPRNEGSGEGRWVLEWGPVDRSIVMADKKLSFEEDREKVMFLERQSKMFGR